MQLSDPLQLRVYYQNRIEINLGTLTEIDIKFATLKSILYDSKAVGVDEMGVIDLTNPDRVYFNNQSSCVLPLGAGQPGWNWKDPYSETLEESLYQVQPETESVQENSGEDTSAETPEGDESGESQSTDDASSSSDAEESSYTTSDGMIMPMMPGQLNPAGSSGTGNEASSSTSSEPSEPSSEQSQESSQTQVGAAGGVSGQGSTGSGVGTEAPSVPGISR